MRCFLISLSLIVGFYSSANNTNAKEHLLHLLGNVNAEWQKQPERNDIAASYMLSGELTYTDWIATHLMLVEKTLSHRNVSSLSASQQANRKALLDKLNSYWHSRAFPINNYTNYRTPIFIDRTGNHCAVGYLMHQSGAEVLAQQISREQKFAYVHDIKVEGVKEWADRNGFTLNELAWIQPTYPPTTQYQPLGKGADGPVDLMFSDATHGVIMSGNFNTLDDVPCHGIGRYINNEFKCMGDGLQGKINSITSTATQVIVAGKIQTGQSSFPIAIYNDTSWSYIDIPNRSGATATAIVVSYTHLYVAISHPSINGQEIWERESSLQQMKKIASVDGTIFDIEPAIYGMVYGGVFNRFTSHKAGYSDTTITVTNAAFYDEYRPELYGINGEVSDTIFVVKTLGRNTYFGGTCSDSAGRSKVCLTRYVNGSLQGLIYTSGFDDDMLIQDIQLYDESKLLIAGQFNNYFSNFSTIGANLATYDLVYGYVDWMANFDNKATGICKWENEWYVGGYFTNNYSYYSGDSLHHLAKMDIPTFVPVISNNNIAIFPNPATDILHISLNDNTVLLETELCDITGRKVFEDKTTASSKDISVTNLPSGIYVLRTLTSNGWGTAKVVKE